MYTPGCIVAVYTASENTVQSIRTSVTCSLCAEYVIEIVNPYRTRNDTKQGSHNQRRTRALYSCIRAPRARAVSAGTKPRARRPRRRKMPQLRAPAPAMLLPAARTPHTRVTTHQHHGPCTPTRNRQHARVSRAVSSTITWSPPRTCNGQERTVQPSLNRAPVSTGVESMACG